MVSLKLLQKSKLKKRLWHRCFPVNIAKFLRTPFYRTLAVASSGKTRIKSLKLVKFQFQLFLTTISWALSSCDDIVVKCNIHRKIFVVVFIHIVIQTSKHNLQRYVLKHNVSLYSEWLI